MAKLDNLLRGSSFGGLFGGKHGLFGGNNGILIIILVFLVLCTDLLEDLFCDDNMLIWIILIVLLLCNFEDNDCCC